MSLAAAILLGIGAAARAQQESPAGHGLDLLVLVDVSGSMSYRHLERQDKEPVPQGSDPERIRWDAVKLMADLLTPDDRMLVQRFTDESPPRYTDEATGQPISFFDPKYERPLRPADDFLPRLIPMLGDQRADLQRRIASFNTTADWYRSLDLGGTRLIHALTVAAGRAGTPAPGRKMHVVLLTDGLDNEYEEGKYRTDEELRAALGFFTGDAPGAEPIPVHTIGLGLFAGAAKKAPASQPEAAKKTPPETKKMPPGKPEKKDPPQAAAAPPAAPPGRDAERFLLRIAALTKGNYYQADTNRDLIGIFFALIRDLKGAWSEEIDFAPSRAGEVRPIAPLPVKGIVSFGAMVFETDTKTANPRCTRPPAKPMKSEWLGLDQAKAPEAVHYTGKDRSVYDYFYYGKDSNEETAKSPFADLPPAARIALSLHGETLPQHLILMHRTQNPLFSMTRPEQGAKFYRHQSLEVRVAMAESDFFRPEQFEVSADVLRAGQSVGGESSAVLLQAGLAPVAGTREFSGLLSLRKLPQGDAAIDYFTLRVTVKGKTQEGNSLAGFQLNLVPRVIAVENTLVLGDVASIELTESQPRASIPLATAYPVLEPLKLTARFEPFRQKGKPVELNDFVFACNGSPIAEKGLTLTEGKGTIDIGFSSTARLPQGGLVYEPGTIVVTGGDGVRMEPLEIAVRLRLALAKIGMEPNTLALEAKSAPVASPTARVVLTPATQAKTAVGELAVEIRKVVAPGDQGGKPLREFGPTELWLQPAGGPPLEPAKRSQRIALRLGEQLVVYVHPQGAKDPGKYPHRIMISGPGADDAQAPLSVLVNPPVLDVQEASQEVYADPGAVASGSFAVRLEGLGSKPEEIVLSPEPGQTAFRFVSTDPRTGGPPLELPFEAPSRRSPLVLQWPKTAATSWGSLPFRITVPKQTRFGRYQCKAIATGKQVSDRPLTIRLVVNSLLVDSLADAGAAGQSPWRSADEVTFLQFFGCEMQKTLRIRTGLGQSLSAADVQVMPLRPFADEKGDAMRLPQVAEVTPEEGGQALRVRLRFPPTPNAHADYPYRVSIKIESPKLHVRPFQAAFRVRFWDPAHFLAQEED